MDLSPNVFFDLEQSPFKALFVGLESVWMAIDRLNVFLSEMGLGEIAVNLPSGVVLENPHLISIGPGSKVEAGAYIRGPCWIGKECEIRHGAYLRGGVAIADRCVVGHATEIKNAILLSESHADHFNYIGDSILGQKTRLGAGAKCANLRFDEELIFISVEGKKIPTNRKKLGAIIGDRAQVGCNAVLNPGTLLGKGAFCQPALCVGGFVPPYHCVRSTVPQVVSMEVMV